MESGSIWWNQVTNAVRFVSDIRKCFLEEKSLLIRYSNVMPWREQFVRSLRESVKIQSGEKKFTDVPEVREPGEYLLKEFCKKEKRAEYRPSKGYAGFFAENDDIVLHDRYLWIRPESADSLEKWLSFASDYIKERGKHERKAVFILEWPGKDNSHVKVKKGIKIFSFDDYIGEYDRIVFVCLASSEAREKIFIKNYITEVVSNVAGNDIELCAECIQGYKSFLDNPLAYIRKTEKEKIRSDGTEFSYDKSEEEVERLMWLSQIKTVYPRLEEFREDFVQKHFAAIAKKLPIETSYGALYEDPKDVELGTLLQMAGNNSLSLNEPEYEKLKRNKEARDKLSHLQALSLDEIKTLFP